MNCPKCNNTITSNSLATNGLICTNCPVTLIMLSKYINTIYPWVCYVIEYNKSIAYIGYTTELYKRLQTHISSEIIFKILDNKISLTYLSLNKYNIKIYIHLILSEYSLCHIYKPIYNICNSLTYKLSRHCYNGKLLDNKLTGRYNISYSLLLDNYNISNNTLNLIRQDTYEHLSYSKNIIQTKIINCNYSGDLITHIDHKTTNIFSDLRSYCYRWSGICYCKIPCKYKVMLLSLIPNNNTQIDNFKENKKKEMLYILHNISPTADYLIKNVPINSINKIYYNLHVEFINKNNMSYTSKTKDTIMSKKITDAIITEDNIRYVAKTSYIYSDKIITLRNTYSDITINNYKRSMNNIIDAYNKYYNKDIFNYPTTLIQYPTKIMEMLKATYTPTSVVSKLSSIIFTLRTSYNNKEYVIKPFDIYIYMYLLEIAGIERDKLEQKNAGKLTEKEEKTFIDWDTILKTRNTMEKSLDISKYSDFMDFVIISLYTYNPPTRADYADMKVFIFDDDIPSDYKDNYCVIDSDKPRFVFWKYKTATGKEPAINEIPDKLVEILFKWLEVNPSEYLLSSKKGDIYTPMTENTLCMRVKNIFKRWTGKAASINTLRHAFISYNSRNDQIIREKEENARKMMHSSSMADKYRRYIY
jgi:hypothetical protein